MAPDSINSWFDLEKKFHEHFFSGSNELKLSDLTSVKQQHDGSIVDYFIRFRDTKFNVFITEKDLADLAMGITLLAWRTTSISSSFLPQILPLRPRWSGPFLI